jgi:mannose-6-phosphate isomerase-like protein (cupin superfamily)
MQSPVRLSYLGGRVWKAALPVIAGPPGPGAPSLKRLQLPQGELAQVHDAEEGARYIAIIELRQGTTRGNHVHKVKREFIYIFSGECLLVVEDSASKARESVPLAVGDLVFVPPQIAHVVRVLKPGQALEYSPDRFDPRDTAPYPIT